MHRLARLSIIVSLLAPFSAPARAQDDDLLQRAWRLANDLPIVDGHIDAPTRMHSLHEDLSQKTGGQFDYPRAVAGGLDAPFMSIYVPATYQDQPGKAQGWPTQRRTHGQHLALDTQTAQPRGTDP